MGFCIGPALGSFVYGYLSYVNTFYFFAGFIGVIGLCSIATLPSSMNQADRPAESSGDDDDRLILSYCQILSNRRSISAFVIMAFAMTASQFCDPTLSVQLISLGM